MLCLFVKIYLINGDGASSRDEKSGDNHVKVMIMIMIMVRVGTMMQLIMIKIVYEKFFTLIIRIILVMMVYILVSVRFN